MKGTRSEKIHVGLLLPEFPMQTHIAWWRVGNAMRQLGAEVRVLSSRRPQRAFNPHPELAAEAKQTFYAWPPAPLALLRTSLLHPLGVLRAAHYLARLPESSLLEKLKLFPVFLASVALARFAEQEKLQLIHVHSCAQSAHLVAMAHEIVGVPYSLRLGGDLEVYGKDHHAKMKNAVLVVPAAEAYVRRLIDEVGVPEERIYWTWVGIDTDEFTPAQPHERGPSTCLRLTTVARLSQTKGHLDVLEALSGLRRRGLDFRWTLAGTGPFEEEIRQRAAELGLTDQIDFRGSLSQTEVVELLRQTDVFILASYGLGEGTPAAVCEAMSCGVPILSTRIGGTMDMIHDGVDGLLIDQHDVEGLERGLHALATDEATRARMARAARANARKFDIREVAREILVRSGVEMEVPE